MSLKQSYWELKNKKWRRESLKLISTNFGLRGLHFQVCNFFWADAKYFGTAKYQDFEVQVWQNSKATGVETKDYFLFPLDSGKKNCSSVKSQEIFSNVLKWNLKRCCSTTFQKAFSTDFKILFPDSLDIRGAEKIMSCTLEAQKPKI